MYKLNQMKLETGLRAFYAIQQGKGLGQFYRSRSLHMAIQCIHHVSENSGSY